MKKYLLLLIGILVITTALAVIVEQQVIAEVLAPPKIFINEFESNPQGSDIDQEYLELYNPNFEPVSIVDWKLFDKNGLIFTIPDGTIIFSHSFYIAQLTGQKLTNSGDNATLKTPEGIIIDQTPKLIDGSDDNRTWQRLPDGTDNWVFQNATKGFPNVPPVIIQNKLSFPACVLATDNITLQAEIIGYCIENVTFSAIINNTQLNLTGTQILPTDFYTATIPSSLLTGSETIQWTVYTSDCFDRTEKDGDEFLKVNSRTSLSINPPSPNGLNNWYISEPTFTLTNPDVTNITNITYRWNGNIFTYNGPFKLEGTPNNGNVKGGIHVLRYWADICGEPEQAQTFYFDFTNPKIINQQPTGQITNQLPTISAYLDEVYQSNSGINPSQVSMYLDNSPVTPIIAPADTIDYTVSYTPASTLSLGTHNVTVTAKDNAGRISESSWAFEIIEQPVFALTINSPTETDYNTKKIPFNLTTSSISEKIEYINYADNNPRWRILCRNCDEYGFNKKKTNTLKEGRNNITIRATNEFQTIQENISLFIDSIPPKISKTEPGKNEIINGSFFQVKYTEDNPVNVMLFWNPNKTLENCTSGRNQYCSTDANLSDFNNQYINYDFTISDGINTVQSKTTRVFVDTTSPILTVNSPKNPPTNNSNSSGGGVGVGLQAYFYDEYGNLVSLGGSTADQPENIIYDTNKIPFNITVSEKVKLEYYDAFDSRPRWKNICSNCNDYGSEKKKTKTFKDGSHNLLIRAIDKAGNSDIEEVLFTII